MKRYKADLHIHSVLSPCGGLEMSAKNITAAVKEAGISIIAITDHNTMANCSVYAEIAEQNGLKCFCGVEIQTAEEIHLVAIFKHEKEAYDFDKQLYRSLADIKNNPDYFGDQVVIDEQENIIRCEEKALINSSSWTLEETLYRLSKYNTLLFPSHIDAASFSIIGQLGFIPDPARFDALEITANCNLADFLRKHPLLKEAFFIRSSDAHYLKDIGKGYTFFYLNEPTFDEIKFACQKKNKW